MLTKQEIRQLAEKEIIEELNKASKDLLKIKMDLESGYAKGSHKATELKRYIARLETIRKESKK